MAKIERFEDLIAWQKARALRKVVKQATAGPAFRRELDFRSQIRRAALSVMSNIAEGFERGSRADFAHFLVMSKASCGEVRSLLYAALDDELFDQGTSTVFTPKPKKLVESSAACVWPSPSKKLQPRGSAHSVLSPFDFQLDSGGITK